MTLDRMYYRRESPRVGTSNLIFVHWVQLVESCTTMWAVHSSVKVFLSHILLDRLITEIFVPSLTFLITSPLHTSGMCTPFRNLQNSYISKFITLFKFVFSNNWTSIDVSTLMGNKKVTWHKQQATQEREKTAIM